MPIESAARSFTQFLSPAAPAAPVHLLSSRCMAPATILLVDSDYDSIAIYSLMLRHHGFTVLHAFDPRTGLQLAFDKHPDLVITELFLPLLDGSTLLERLRGDGRTAETPLIILDSVPAFAERMMASLKPIHRLTKPCEPSRLLNEVHRLLDSR